ncbi:chromosome partitioning protein [Micromonospora sp. MA102]|uniref:MinD/ParA family ATP-binding protein n=1 Tax=Micromonospora sp. MA102 TaxID=2952755 RepID=UPI0021CA6DCD|nr:chromosome partitioning protein [Micromonospora sp. MA102]
MVHENADRAHVPGQPQVPERDVEPLWPPEQTDGGVTAPPWAAPAQPNVAAWPVPPAWPTPSPAEPAPSTADGTEVGAPAGDAVPAPHAARAPVDLDLPFTLDQPAAAAPGVPAPRTAAAHPGDPAGADGAAGADAAAGPQAGVGTDAEAAPVQAAAPDGPVETANTDGASGAPETTPETAGATSADTSAGTDGTPGEADATSGERRAETQPIGRPESPWAQPPQRSTADASTPPAHPGPVPPTQAAAPATPVHPPEPPATTPSTPAHPVQPQATGPAHPGATDPATPVHPGEPNHSTQGHAGEPDNPTAAAAATGTADPAQPGPTAPDPGQPAVGTAQVGPDRPAEGSPPRLGPFPPSPGVPLQQPYGDGTGYPPGPVGYGQPAPQAGAPGWYPPAWPQQAGPPPQPGAPQQPPVPPQPGPQQPGPHQAGPQQPGAYPEQVWTPASGAPPTAEDFARRRQARPVDPVATMGVRAVVNKIGLVRLAPGRQEQEMRRDIEMVRRNFGGLRQVTVVNPKGGAGKTVAILLLAMTFGQKRGGYVLAWDNNETQGTLGMRAQQDFHSRTVRDMLRDLGQFQGPHGRVGDLSQYVRSQGEGMFDVLASDESATGGEMLTAAAFAEIREVVSRFYKLIFVDTGNNVRAQNWQAAMDATDQLVVTMSARNDSAETAARMLDHLEQSGRQRLVRQAVTVVSMPPSRKEIDLPAIQEHFAARTRAVLLAPYERLIDTGEPIRYGQLSSATRDAWLKIAASVAEGL